LGDCGHARVMHGDGTLRCGESTTDVLKPGELNVALGLFLASATGHLLARRVQDAPLGFDLVLARGEAHPNTPQAKVLIALY